MLLANSPCAADGREETPFLVLTETAVTIGTKRYIDEIAVVIAVLGTAESGHHMILCGIGGVELGSGDIIDSPAFDGVIRELTRRHLKGRTITVSFHRPSGNHLEVMLLKPCMIVIDQSLQQPSVGAVAKPSGSSLFPLS